MNNSDLKTVLESVESSFARDCLREILSTVNPAYQNNAAESLNTAVSFCILNQIYTAVPILLSLGASKEAAMAAFAGAGDIDSVNAYLEMGVNINAIGHYGNSALHFAAVSNQPKMVALLLEHGADTEIKNNEGETALFYCLSMNEINYTILAFLLENHANLEAVNHRGSAILSAFIESRFNNKIEIFDFIISYLCSSQNPQISDDFLEKKFSTLMEFCKNVSAKRQFDNMQNLRDSLTLYSLIKNKKYEEAVNWAEVHENLHVNFRIKKHGSLLHLIALEINQNNNLELMNKLGNLLVNKFHANRYIPDDHGLYAFEHLDINKRPNFPMFCRHSYYQDLIAILRSAPLTILERVFTNKAKITKDVAAIYRTHGKDTLKLVDEKILLEPEYQTELLRHETTLLKNNLAISDKHSFTKLFRPLINSMQSKLNETTNVVSALSDEEHQSLQKFIMDLQKLNSCIIRDMLNSSAARAALVLTTNAIYVSDSFVNQYAALANRLQHSTETTEQPELAVIATNSDSLLVASSNALEQVAFRK